MSDFMKAGFEKKDLVGEFFADKEKLISGFENDSSNILFNKIINEGAVRIKACLSCERLVV